MKIFWALAAFACFALLGTSVYLGALNQDEGWYLYAAKLVSEGQTLYRDFAFTQAPLLPTIYGALAKVWLPGGILAARVLTAVFGLFAIFFATATAHFLAPRELKKNLAICVFCLLANNLYHLYYLAIPKTYALTSFFLSLGFYLLARALFASRKFSRILLFIFCGLSLAFAGATRISFVALLASVGFALLVSVRRLRGAFVWFGLGGALGLALAFGPTLLDARAWDGLLAAQSYHLARGETNAFFLVGSFSRLVRWYLPIFVFFGLAIANFFLSRKFSRKNSRENEASEKIRENFRDEKIREKKSRWMMRVCFASFALIFAIQMTAPHPYEDYQVPLMSLLALGSLLLLAAKFANFNFANFQNDKHIFLLPILAMGLSWACAFGSPLLESWTTNGHDRFWTRTKAKSEVAQLRDVAKIIRALDPNGTTLFTQDLYLAIETNRHVPKGLEMGPFSILSDDAWRALLANLSCPLAAVSGYTFAICPPRCDERALETQIEFSRLLKKNYTLVYKENDFGQHATTLLILKRKSEHETSDATK